MDVGVGSASGPFRPRPVVAEERVVETEASRYGFGSRNAGYEPRAAEKPLELLSSAHQDATLFPALLPSIIACMRRQTLIAGSLGAAALAVVLALAARWAIPRWHREAVLAKLASFDPDDRIDAVLDLPSTDIPLSQQLDLLLQMPEETLENGKRLEQAITQSISRHTPAIVPKLAWLLESDPPDPAKRRVCAVLQGLGSQGLYHVCAAIASHAGMPHWVLPWLRESFGASAATELLAQSAAAPLETRWHLLDALRALGEAPPDSIAALRQLVDDESENPETRRRALKALVVLDADDTALVWRLGDLVLRAASPLRREALEQVKPLGPRARDLASILAPIVGSPQDGWSDWQAAAEALSAIGAVEGLDLSHARAALASDDETSRFAAVCVGKGGKSFGALIGPLVELLARCPREHVPSIQEAVTAFGADAVPELMARLDPDDESQERIGLVLDNVAVGNQPVLESLSRRCRTRRRLDAGGLWRGCDRAAGPPASRWPPRA